MSKESSLNGLGIGTVLFLIFMVLKLTHNIDWSWWWITAPIWAPLGFYIVITVLFFRGIDNRDTP